MVDIKNRYDLYILYILYKLAIYKFRKQSIRSSVM